MRQTRIADKKKSSNNEYQVSRSRWRQLFVDLNESQLASKDGVLLSPHIINLRPSTNLVPDPKVRHNDHKQTFRPGVNFINGFVINKYSLTNLLNRLRLKNNIGDLSVYLLLEMTVLFVDLLWLVSLYFFIKLYDEASVIIKSILDDIKTFLRVTKLVLLFPFKFLNYPKQPAATKYRPVIFQPKQLFLQSCYFAVLALIITLPLKGVATLQNLIFRGDSVINLANTGFSKLDEASSLLATGNADLAEEHLNAAQKSFNEALIIVNDISNDLSGWLNRLPVASSKLDAARNILTASQEITKAGSIAAEALGLLIESPTSKSLDIRVKLNIINNASDLLKQHLSSAKLYLTKVDESDLPSEYAPKLAEVNTKIDDIEVGLSSVFSLPKILNQILANNQAKTYVVIFQNTSELRPTGGFAGSLALIEFADGQVQSINIPGGGPYDFQGSLKSIIRPPEPLRLVRGTWQLQDANWFFDFPASAKKIMWFIKEAGGPETDGLISLNSDVVVNLLKLTGPIELSDYGKVLTADNFMRETQAAVEIEYDREENRPKQFIADLTPILFAKIIALRGQNLINLSTLINSSLIDRGLQLYSAEPSIEDQFVANGWAGQIINSPSDYLAIVRTNIGGGKTDAVIREKVEHSVEITPTGELITHVSLTRTHNGDARDTFESRRNVSYVRFYVPLGSELLGTRGFTPPPISYYRSVPPEAVFDKDLLEIEHEQGWDKSSVTRITEEFNKTVYGNWLSISPGESITTEIIYKLPFHLNPSATWQDLRRYSILFQRQSGVDSLDFSSKITWPDSYRLRWQEASSVPVIDSKKIEIRSDWSSDIYYGIILEKI